jgi:uncharacterized protein YceK
MSRMTRCGTRAVVGPKRSRTLRAIPLMLVTGAALLAGCGSSSSSSSSTSTSASTTTATTAAAAANVTISLHGNGETGQGTTATLRLLPKASPAGGLQPKLAGLQGLSFPQKLQTFGDDVANFWGQSFKAGKVNLPAVKMTLVDTSPATCGSTSISTTDKPTYCGPDGAIYLPVAYMSRTLEPIGDAAVLLEVSALYGYHIEDSLGFFTAAQQGKITGAQLRELNMCLSGVYFSSVGKRNLLTSGDSTAVAKLIAAKADAPGTPASNATVTARDLTNAFVTGFKSANPGACVGKG